MKKYIIAILLSLSVCAYSQEVKDFRTVPQPNPKSRFLLFPTTNFWNLIELDTATGLIWQVQYSMDSEKRFSCVLNSVPLIGESDKIEDGRFFLYPTNNMYTFILLDQKDGRTWQVQWSLESDKRFVVPIY